MTQAQAIYLYQPTLQSIAYNMLGSIADAEDAVHDAFMKWLSIDTSKIDNTKAYLIKMVTNACLNVLQSKKEKFSIDGLADVLPDGEKESAITHFDVENQLNEAWKFLYRKLEPLERTVFVLREVFHVEYEDLQLIVDRKAENCRKIVSRAKEKLRNTELPKFSVSLPEVHLLDSLKAAIQKGNLSQLVQDFTSELFHKKK